MSSVTAAAMYWAPRVLGVLMAAFLSVFAFDVFDEGAGFLETLVALAMHLVPSAMVLVALALAWRRQKAGAALFAGLGILYIAAFWGRFPVSAYFVIAGPLFVIALLFLATGSSPSAGPDSQAHTGPKSD